jgi:uracil-DNA glycosylase
MRTVFEPGDTVIDVRARNGSDADVLVYDAVGRFPFGQPAWTAAPRRVEHAAAFVLGVYPSALHVRWDNANVSIRALAVDNEPWPFWDGEDAAARAHRIEDWKREVNWSPDWGTVADAGPLNGSSGRWLRDSVLQPLEIPYEHTWLTDALPVFHVHGGRNRQATAMRERYNPWAAQHDLAPYDLPDRPTPSALIARAVTEHADRLRDEIHASGTDLIITLGDEALRVLGRVLGIAQTIGTRVVADGSYGERRSVTVDGRRLTVIPLVHPGQHHAVWRGCHDRWVQRRINGSGQARRGRR